MPHGHSVPANVQLSAALSPVDVPYVEFLVKWNQILQFFFKDPVLPVNGVVKVPTGPGMGIEIDPAKIDVGARVHGRLIWRVLPSRPRDRVGAHCMRPVAAQRGSSG